MTQVSPIREHLKRLAGGLRGWTFASGAMILAAGVLWFSLLFVVLDLLLQLPAAWCWIGFVLLVGGVAAGGYAVYRATRRILSPVSVSTRIEQAAGSLDNRLVNVVQFAESPNPEDQRFAELLLAEHPLVLDSVRSRKLFPRDWLKYPFMLTCGGLLLALLLQVALGPGFTTSMARLLAPMAGIKPYSMTRIAAVDPGDTAVVKGNAMEVVVRFEGVLPKSATVELDVERLPAKRLPMERVEGERGAFAVRTPSLFNRARYRIRGGDARSDWYDVRVDSLPALEVWEVAATPPAYMGTKAVAVNAETERKEIPWGSTVTVKGTASQALARVSLRQQKEKLGETELADQRAFEVTGRLRDGSGLQVGLRSLAGLEARAPLPVVIVPDRAPAVDFVAGERRLRAGRTEVLPIEFSATDDYGVKAVSLEHVVSAREFQTVGTAPVNGIGRKQFNGRFMLDMSTFKAKPGSRLRFRLTAIDHGPDPADRRGISRTLEVYVPLPAERRLEKQRLTDRAERTIKNLIAVQQKNLDESRLWQGKTANRGAFAKSSRELLLARQTKVREIALRLTGAGSVLGDLQAPLVQLIQTEMLQAIAAFQRLVRAPDDEVAGSLAAAIKLEVRILAVLRGLPKALTFEQSYQEKADLLGALQKIVTLQQRNLVATKRAQGNKAEGDVLTALVDAEDDIADRTSIFLEEARKQARMPNDDFAEQLQRVVALMDTKHKLYEKMVGVAAQLEEVNYPAAIQSQEEIVKVLLECLDIVNKWRVKKARETVEKAHKTIQSIAEKLEELEAKQTKIVEVTKDLAKRDKIDQEVKDTLAKMDEEQKEMKQDIEKMAQDLYQFPELPVANELNSKMREIYEDVEQAANSENEPAVEIAVQKEDSLLDAIKNTKERVEDVEMWLPDKPDNIKWDMESFDAEEFPEMPLVDLPEELEDIVGELLDQSSDIEDKSQDSTGNNMIADMEMGWDIADGPMPSFSAKGKSGNTKPNDNEMTGRSGAGREGQSNGELVENTVKGLEGRETHARRTEDPFQKGQVTEEEDSTMDARATGGGKLGGESENIGMFGSAPRRDLHMQPGEKVKKLRQETEALYATSRMLYLGNTANLGNAAGEMRRFERVDKEMRDLSVRQRVIRRLSDSHTSVTSGAVLKMPVSGATNAGGQAAIDEVDLDKIDDRYRSMVSDYYKSLGE